MYNIINEKNVDLQNDYLEYKRKWSNYLLMMAWQWGIIKYSHKWIDGDLSINNISFHNQEINADLQVVSQLIEIPLNITLE